MSLVRLITLAVGFALLWSVNTRADLLVTEVMANEPNGSTSLEWFEIHNSGQIDVHLGIYQVRVAGQTITLPGWLLAGEYAIICRKLYGDGGSPAFEETWGNGSGTWGDDPRELYGEPIEFTFPILNNTNESIEVFFGLTLISSLSWNEDGEDGISWEGIKIGSSLFAQVGQSVDYSGSTPGFVNSLTPLDDDLGLERIEVSWENALSVISYTVVNRSLTARPGGAITLYRHNVADSTNRTDEIRVTTVPALDSAETIVLTERLWLDSMYVHLGASLGDDDRERNNHRFFVAPASKYPPVILSEIMANPTGGLKPVEWVEIQSQVDTAVNLFGWSLGDSTGVYPIAEGTLILPPFEYMILTSDSSGFKDFYPLVTAPVFEPYAWRKLNNNRDASLLVDSFGIVADRYDYVSVFDSNYTWSRIDGTIGPTNWGRSFNAGGSPGELNHVILDPTGSKLDIIISPQVFSPDGDNQNDTAYIKIIPPVAPSYTMKIYDRYGREVRSLIDAGDLRGFCDVEDDGERYVWCWDGFDDNGQRLPVGIYILYFEATGLESVKSSVVIAR